MSDQTGALKVNSELGWDPGHNPWVIALSVTLATFMEVLDTSVANVALPHIAGGLAAGQDESTWVLTSYLVSNAIVLPLSGWLSSTFGRKRFYMSCVAIFTLSSFLCGIAPSLLWLIVFRIIQGAAGGGLQPSEQAILADTFPAAKRGMAFAVYGMAVVAAPALGPTIGGWITDNYSWRWIFFINIPIGILSIFLTTLVVSDPPWLRSRKGAGVKVDYMGFALLALGLGALQVILDKGEREDWFEARYIVVLAIISAVCLAAVYFWELRHKHPIIEVRLFGDRTFLMACIMLFMVGFVLYGTTVLLPQFAQTLMGYTAELAGLMIMPGGFTIMICLPLVGFLLARYDARLLIAFGFLLLAISMFSMAHSFNLDVDFKTLLWARVFQSSGLAFLFIPINTAAYAYLPREKNNAASGLINLARNVGGSVGISFVTTMLARRMQFHQSVLTVHASSFNPQLQAVLHGATQRLLAPGFVTAQQRAFGQLYGSILRQASMIAYLDNFWVLAASILVMIPFVFLMKRPPKGIRGE
ncbi:MAG TPA: DHA2 family efflux MFS transporter permease subunit [Acidobacteriota bacterium]|nr:DHA2 family efflux MFS transporter permease subunit [Acidobacteriota bacterium]